MSRLLVALVPGILTACASVVPIAAPPRQDLEDSLIRQVNLVFGTRELEDPAWEGVDQPTTMGIDCTQGYGSRWLFPEGGFHYADDEGSATDANGSPVRANLDLFEISAGVLAQWPRDGSWVRPYLGTGAAMVHVDADIADNGVRGEDDDVFGFYWKAGLLVSVSLDSHMGLEVRGFEGGTVTTELAESDIDSVQFALVLGASF